MSGMATYSYRSRWHRTDRRSRNHSAHHRRKPNDGHVPVPLTQGLTLFYADGSPFATKIILAVHELGLSGGLELQPLPEHPSRHLVDSNDLYPLSSFVPTLVTPQGTIFDSSVILQYLDSLSTDPERKIYPHQDTRERWQALTYEALCKGVVGTAMMIQRQSDLDNTPNPALNRQEENVQRGLGRLARYRLPHTDRAMLDIEGISLVTLLWYLSRWSWSSSWRFWEGCGDLAQWFELVMPTRQAILDTGVPRDSRARAN